MLNDHQYGFRSKRSTGDLISFLTHQINNCIHGYGESQLISLDIAKAFDAVWHKCLLSKMTSFGFDISLVQWTESFLSNRSIRVVMDGISSDRYGLQAGVPQGSCLSPTLFLIFINDLLSCTNNSIHSFADDSTLHSSYTLPRNHVPEDVRLARINMSKSLNDDLSKISIWSEDNLVKFNASKTQSCFFFFKQARFLHSRFASQWDQN